ncbi:MAG: long-chain fatty acid--CoA ligase [Acidimicrobiales bacterium]
MYITQGLHRSLLETPDRVATICGDRQRTFAELGDRIARLAGALQGLGVASGDRVAILSLNSDRYLEYLFAVPWADAVLNPINTRWSDQEVAYCLNDSDSRVLVVDDALAPMVPALREQCPQLATVVHAGDGPTPDGLLSYEDMLAAADPIPDVRRGGQSLAGLFYTGGTTGFSKGVMLSHTNLVTSAMGCTATGEFVSAGGSYLHAAPMFHAADQAGGFGGSLVGVTHVIVPGFDPKVVLDAISVHGVTDALLVPTMIQVLVDHPDLSQYDLSTFRNLAYGGSAIAEAVLERTKRNLPNVRLMQAYGMTELSPVTTLLRFADHEGARIRSAGRAAPHSEVRILDADDNEVPRGTVGEICSYGGHVMLGYWNKPEETAAAIRNGWMHSGDGGYMDDDGYVFVVDRLKDMIVTGGENVYTAEVEQAVALHPAVASCAVIGIPDPEWGEAVHAVVVLALGATVTSEELREHCKTLIAGYKSPRSAEFVDALPVNGAGKVLKRNLRAPYWEGIERNVG